MPEKRKGTMPSPPAKRPRISHENEESSEQYEQPRQNYTYGQRGAFPGLDDGGDELFYGPADDGMEYLRMVRSEANALPTLFVASTQTSTPQDSSPSKQNDSEPPSARKSSMPSGFFAKESAYIAPAITTDANAHSPSKLEDLYPPAQISYYNLLRHRFLLLRSTLRCSPPAEAIRALDSSHPVSLPRNSGSAHREWRRLLLAVNPQMVQVACMDMESVLEALELLARMISDVVKSENAERARRSGAWAWALLGKCREVGQLTTEEVGVIRNLGKRAATILRKVQELESSRSQWTEPSVSTEDAEDGDLKGDGSKEDDPQETAVDEDEPTKQEDLPEDLPEATGTSQPIMPDVSGETDELEAAKARLEARLQSFDGSAEAQNAMPDAPLEQSEVDTSKARLQDQPQSIDEPTETPHDEEEYLVTQTRALLDMVLTVVGEFFGQRDLLESREAWI
ncbi:hypothetical protein N7541_010314 [Penicillium brevicompactum]|uniref:Uncharacterized protein n=1 Tax=Penicillium brevicompactum TaxID=5074 RepID=A0A9W9QNN7_PENBR|nr:hypothetical protein N7541_010314 [Penicillium brevicompactum]